LRVNKVTRDLLCALNVAGVCLTTALARHPFLQRWSAAPQRAPLEREQTPLKKRSRTSGCSACFCNCPEPKPDRATQCSPGRNWCGVSPGNSIRVVQENPGRRGPQRALFALVGAPEGVTHRPVVLFPYEFLDQKRGQPGAAPFVLLSALARGPKKSGADVTLSSPGLFFAQKYPRRERHGHQELRGVQEVLLQADICNGGLAEPFPDKPSYRTCA
jgi:hypothetical protein